MARTFTVWCPHVRALATVAYKFDGQPEGCPSCGATVFERDVVKDVGGGPAGAQHEVTEGGDGEEGSGSAGGVGGGGAERQKEA